ncbi:MAG: UDP-N-acetylmuramoyl-L-alanyl-D-glutamate--2,6-diaminopimelate ligase [bacterium]
MKLSKLVKGTENAVLVHFADHSIRGIALDSRRVRPGALFAVVPGRHCDGRRFVPHAVARGAVAVLSDQKLEVPDDVTLILVPDVRVALADLCCRFHGYPADHVRTVGVTGTNGKTTVATLSRSILATAGKQPALLSTCMHQIGSRCIEASNTTPESVALQRFFAEMVERGIGHAVMEVSSHSLAEHRVRGIPFEVAAFTNITEHEHLDYHGSFAAYRRAKARLFESLGPKATAVLNHDDEEFSFFLNRARQATVMTYGLRPGADVTARVEALGLGGMTLTLHTPMGQARVRSPLVGRYNVLNLLAGACIGLALGLELGTVARGIERFTGAPGRLERVEAGQDFAVLVDYAHNADGLRSVLGTLRELTGEERRLIVVFGAGGDRDRTKRPLMGQAAAELADVVVLTADNSRSEATEAIIGEIERGFDHGAPPHVEPNRREAIRKALEMARPGDVVVIAGKGHETYQDLGGVRHRFDDREETRRVLLHLATRHRPFRRRVAVGGIS